MGALLPVHVESCAGHCRLRLDYQRRLMNVDSGFSGLVVPMSALLDRIAVPLVHVHSGPLVPLAHVHAGTRVRPSCALVPVVYLTAHPRTASYGRKSAQACRPYPLPFHG